MGTEPKDGFLKQFIVGETKETIIELKKLFHQGDGLKTIQNKTILKSINQYLETIQQSTARSNSIHQNRMNKKQIFELIEIILDKKLDFRNRFNKQKSVLDVWQKSRASKNEEVSRKCRETGNELLRNNQLDDALKYYNEALLFASPNNFNYALAFANRAVVFFKLKEFKLSIEDVHAAIDSEKYPEENLHKLYRRLAESYETLQQFDKSIHYYEKIEPSLKLSRLTKAQQLQIIIETEKSLSFCKNARVGKSQVLIDEKSNNVDFPKYKATHVEIPNASGNNKIHS